MSTLRRFGRWFRGWFANPALPKTCVACGGRFHKSGTISGIVAAFAGALLATVAFRVSGSEAVAGVVIALMLISMAVLSWRAKLVPSTERVVWSARAVVALVVLLAVVWSMYSIRVR